MICRTFCLVFAMIGTLLEPVSAQVLSLDNIMSRKDPQNYVDALGPNDRSAVVSALADELKSVRNKTELAKLLCAIRPWTTGDAKPGGEDHQIQLYIWRQMAQLDVHSEDFRWFDCAATNRTGGYRDSALSPLYDLRQSYCTGLPISLDFLGHLDRVEGSIRAFNADVEVGLSEAAGEVGVPPRQSFFPMQNRLRLAVIRSARAVEIARRNNDWSTAQAEFGAIAAELRETADKSDYASIRNGWNFVNDLAFYGALYAWLAGADDTLEMEALLSWPSLLDDPNNVGAVPASIREQITRDGNEGYVDMIYVERIFPGAARPPAECDGWRRRSYNVHELSATVKRCSELVGRPEGFEGLAELDACILQYDANDWRVEFMRVPAQAGEGEAVRLRAFLRKVMRDPLIVGLPEAERADLEAKLNKFSQEKLPNGMILFATKREMTTEQRTLLEQVFDRVPLGGNRPLLARPKIY